MVGVRVIALGATVMKKMDGMEEIEVVRAIGTELLGIETPATIEKNESPGDMKAGMNDRLGTSARIPCLPTDTIGDFKKLLANQIGRKPHEIMLKRQGERPFRDFITLEDYSVTNGAQLDLELDTSD
ncbi:ubiquitin-like protein [Microthyrium microscopicum]|uniref:Ubiquitin-like modifier HUB1 n=1 Tax=Microthyrium microscopicum TaxID=703497 RepID=A0A6A6UR10_9PEZI|nr:ubiquitin-like protein [Microthyrium microscopicum]